MSVGLLTTFVLAFVVSVILRGGGVDPVHVVMVAAFIGIVGGIVTSRNERQ